MAGGTTFMGFGIRIDVLSQGALFAFAQLSTKALALIGVLSEVAGQTMKFEKALADLSRLVVISSGTAEGLKQKMTELGSEILRMSTSSVYAFNEVAEAFSYLMRAGFSASEAIIQLEKSIVLATAVGMDLAEATRTQIRLMNAFAYAGREISNVADMMVQSEIEFMMTTAELNTALNMVGSTAIEAGFSFGQIATALGVMYSAGINASTAGTVLRRALSAVMDVTPSAAESIESLGINMAYFETLVPIDRLRVLAAAIEQIEDPTARLSYAFEIFGIRGVNIMPVLGSLNSDFDELALRIDTASGIAKEAADAFEATLYGKLVMLGQAVQNTMVLIGEMSLTTDGAIKVFTSLAVIVLVVTSAYWKKYIAMFAVKTMTWAEFVASLKLLFLKIQQWLWDLKNTIGLWMLWVAKNANLQAMKQGFIAGIKAIGMKIWNVITNFILSGSYTILSLTVKSATFAVKAFMKALGPIGLLLSIIGAIIMVVRDEFGGFGGIMEMLKPLWNDLKEFFKAFVKIVMALAEALMPLVRVILKVFVKLLAVLIRPIRVLLKLFVQMMPLIEAIVMIIAEIIIAFVSWIEKTGLMNVLMGVFEFVMKAIYVAIALVMNIFIALANAVIWFLNIFRKKDNKIDYIEFMPMKPPTEEEMADPGEDDEGNEIEPPPPDEVNPPDDTGGDLPPGGTDPTPTGTGSDSVSSRGGGGGGQGGDSIAVYIYITPELGEMWDSEAFGDALGKAVALEIRRSRGSSM